MQLFSFHISRKKPLFGNASNSLEYNQKIRMALQNFLQDAEPLIATFDVTDDKVSYSIPEINGDEMLEAKGLRGTHDEVLRLLRYTFRDWAKAVYECLNQKEILAEIGIGPDDLKRFLAPENATLWASTDLKNGLEWRCCLGFEFNNHSDNFLTHNAGPYKAKPEDSSETNNQPSQYTNEEKPPHIMGDADAQKESKNDTAQTPPTRDSLFANSHKWWNGKLPQIALIFCSGFLLAAIIGSLYYRANTCDTSSLEQHIRDLQMQVDQRCDTPETAQP